MFGLGLWQTAALGVSALIIIGGAYAFGYQRGHFQALLDAEKAQTAAVTKAALEARALGIAEGQITITSGAHFADVQTKIVTRTITQIKEVRVLVPPKADAACVINTGFVQLHDSAAGEPSAPALPDATGQPIDGPSTIALSDVAATVTANYGTYYQVRTQLIELQDWIRKQQALHP